MNNYLFMKKASKSSSDSGSQAQLASAGGSRQASATSMEHPDTQSTIRSMISVRSVHNHEAIQMGALLQPGALPPRTSSVVEHASTHHTVRSVKELLQEFEEQNMEAVELAWKDLTVTNPDGSKTLLAGASGKVQGSFLAIMGPSGSGKTTMMNVLACRSGGMQSDGTKVINGTNYSLSELKSVSGYVMQDDLLNGKLTVEETLYYAAELRLPSNMTTAEKRARIDEVIHQLGLTECRHVVIGDHMTRGISGGQRKRVAVAIELLTRPRLLFLDEPTSGLDSVTALSLCTLLRDIAHSGQCTVVTTIHQPQSKIFFMFDDLILLKAGRIIFYGATSDVTDFFSEAGFPCPSMTNPADHILDVITAQTQEQKATVEEAEQKLMEMQKNKNAVVEIEQDSSVMTNKIVHGHQRSSWWHQFVILLQRCMTEQIRSRSVIITTLIQSTLMAILIGTVFLQIGTTQSSIIRRQPMLFFCVINQGLFSALTLINSFPKERTLVLRERAAGTYYVSAYFVAKNLAEMATQIIAPVLFSCIVYFLVGLQMDAGKFFIFMLFMTLGSVAATSLAMMVSALARTTDMSVTILPMILELARLYGGFFLSPADLPRYFVWLDAISYVKYTYVGISLNELTGLTLTCENTPVNGTCITSGETTMNTLGFNEYSIGLCVGVLVAYIFLTRAIAYLGVRYIKW